MGVGFAIVDISFAAWKDGNVAPSRHRVEVLAAKPGPAREPASERLRTSLSHPNKTGTLEGLSWSPDGRRLVAGDYPGGVVQVWDVGTGRDLQRFETGYGYRTSARYFHLSPDWTTIIVGRYSRRVFRVEQGGKEVQRWEHTGDVRLWDVESGRLLHIYRNDPPRGVLTLTLSPNGAAMLTGEGLSGDGEPGHGAGLWDVKAKTHRTLPGRLAGYGAFSPDGQTVAVATAEYQDVSTSAVKLFDVATAKETLHIPINAERTRAAVTHISRDGRLVIGTLQTFPEKENWDVWHSSLKMWDSRTGAEVASFPAAEPNSAYSQSVLSPDGRLLAVTTWRGERGKLFLFDLPKRTLENTVTFEKSAVMRQPAFSPDGRWLAVASQVFSEEAFSNPRDLSPDDVAQPRVHLIEVATGEVREVIVLPPAFTQSAAFSPDGRTLATDGRGKVHLWDMSAPPGANR